MTTDDKYNGWTNRETWALNAVLSNDEGLYNLTRERVRDARDGFFLDNDDTEEYTPRLAGEVVKDLWEGLTDPDEGLSTSAQIIGYLQEVGSSWRINWDEIGAAWLEDQS